MNVTREKPTKLDLSRLTRTEEDRAAMQQFQRDSIWCGEHEEELREEYRDHWIAVKNFQVLAADTDLETLVEGLRQQGVDLRYTYITFVPTRPMKYILWRRSRAAARDLPAFQRRARARKDCASRC